MRCVRFAIAGLGLLAAPLSAQTPQLVRDINQTADPEPGTDPTELTAHLGALFYVGEDSANGPDLRRMDGTGAVTCLLDSRDPQDPREVTPAGPWLYFAADRSLFRTDGTPAGTVRVRSFASDFIHGLTYANGFVFFVRNSVGNEELWRSDGTEAGTIALGAADPLQLTAGGTRLFFLRTTTAAGRELWTSDGTLAGTQMVLDVCPGSCDGVSSFEALVAVGGTAYFAGNDNVHGFELWRSDGTPLGTSMVQDSVPGALGLDPWYLYPFGNGVLFTIGSDHALWFSNGTAAGTRLLRADLRPELTIHDAGGVAYFGAQDVSTPSNDFGLWTTDGTPAGTRLVSPVCAGGCSHFPFFGSLSGVTVFGAPKPTNFSDELWRTDGTAAGTIRISSADLLGPLERFGNALYFRSYQPASGFELWRTDGTPAGTVQVTERTESHSYPTMVSNLGDRMFFNARRPDIGEEFWNTTGTAATTSVLDLNPGPGSSFVSTGIDLDGALVFGRFVSSSGSLWRTDGTPAGTLAIDADLRVHGTFARMGGEAVFGGGGQGGSFSNVEPWKTNGTSAGTLQVADLKPGFQSSSPFSLASFRGEVAFIATDLAYSVWITDGTAAGTKKITSRRCFSLLPVDDKLFMVCDDAVTGQDLWASDGTEAGTRRVRDLPPGFSGDLTAAEGYLYFRDDSWNVWRSDGTEAGTQKVEDLVGFPVLAQPDTLVAVREVLFFMGYQPATGYEPWRTDGTPAGTFLLKDVYPGPDSGMAWGSLSAAGGRVFFSAYTPATGWEPWQSDGTAAGTVPLPEVVPGPASSTAGPFSHAGGRVYFPADDNVTGIEPWTVALPTGIVSVGDAVRIEGDTGATSAVFPVNLESAAAGVITVGYTTASGTAQAGTDFIAQSGSLTFQPGQTSTAVPVSVLGDLTDETDEAFTLELSGTATFADRRGLGLIVDDDGPTATIANASVTEGNAGNTPTPFLVTLTTRDGNPTPNAKTVGFATSPGTATAGTDYLESSGTLTFPAGTTSGTTASPSVAVVGDTVDEPDETFRVALTPTSDVTVPASAAVGLIRDDDGIASAPPVELAHGSVVRATLEPPAGRVSDRDWYLVRQQPFASYELVVDETSGDAIPLQVERMGADGSTVLQGATATGTGGSVSLRWENAGSEPISDQPIRVGSAACGTSCGADDGYRVRLYETTLAAPRVNNSGTQVTVAILQNTSDLAIAGRLQFWLTAGVAAVTVPFQLTTRQVLVLNTSGPYPNGTGTLTVTHDGPYGSLVGKAVALEPSTGFSFDTPMTYRPR